jgi:CheY-like chemotaxis protein
VIREIRKIDASVPAFVMSGYSEDPAIADPEQFGFNGSLSKPFKYEDLEELLATYFAVQ